MTKALALFFGLHSIAGGVKPARDLKPRIVNQDRVPVEGCKERNDPLSPCEGMAIIVDNPSKVVTNVTVNCGTDDELTMSLEPQKLKFIFIEFSLPFPGDALCTLKINKGEKL